MSPRLLRPVASGFNPKAISGLVGWWDASDTATVTTDSGAVSQLNDKSGLARHATQTTPNNRPAYSGTLNGRNVMTFDGSNDSLATGLESNTLTGFATMFSVCRPDFADATAAAFRTPLLGRDTTTSNPYGLTLFNSSGTLSLNTFWRGVGFNAAGGPQITLGTPAILVGGITATQFVRRVSGNAANFTSTPTQGTNSAAGNFLQIGQDPSQSRWWNGLIAETLVYDRALTLTEISTIEKYLGKKWGITIA
jgi:hypothetical protein